MKTLKIVTLIILSSLASCADKTPQSTQDAMFSGVWNPTPAFLGRSASSVKSGRYYGASDFFNN